MRDLYTKEGKRLADRAAGDASFVPWNTYPRPQMVRGAWQCLNGWWDFAAGEGEAFPERILVPFCPESLLSGIHKTYEEEDTFRYRRRFRLELPREGRRILLHFGAVDQEAEVFVNGRLAGRHEGGYLPFSLDITALVGEENELRVTAKDPLSHRLPWGKQKKDRGGMWYTPVSGIWQSVWLEAVPDNYIRHLDIQSGLDRVRIRAEGISEGTLRLEEEEESLLPGGVREFALKEGCAEMMFERPVNWTPDNPKLYYFTLRSGEDEVRSYFALRSISSEVIEGVPRLCLNRKPFYFHGLLDQGYFSDGLYTPAEPALYEQDILAMKSLGFNMLRKHIKIEPEQFYFDCDRLGMIVFQDMVNNGEYNFFRDTVLPTVGILKLGDRRPGIKAPVREAFYKAMEGTVRLLSPHPCICAWTIFNEGWGQFEADRAYEKLKKLDGSRLIDATSGWFHREKSDVDSLHIYFKKLHLGKEKKPQLLSEFGGYVWKEPEHSSNTEKTYGYRILKSREEFLQALRALYEEQLLPLIGKGLCGSIYTQVSDVEDETNGMLTYDRCVLKIRPEEFSDVSARLIRAGADCQSPEDVVQ
ncbi:MAG: glycoside hydrolase family 2 [Lachnospiraceae bacterium]|nr:glycoside hydrolase family 2 [Lachnospiraceae bacterium]